MKIDIDIDLDTADAILVERLKDHLAYHKKDRPKHPEDIDYRKKIIPALKMVIEYYGG